RTQIASSPTDSLCRTRRGRWRTTRMRTCEIEHCGAMVCHLYSVRSFAPRHQPNETSNVDHQLASS
ncbi:unnamed protein product, partial [Mycena citricolor]